MPAHDYVCTAGHKFEVVTLPSKVKDKVRCRKARCKRMAVISWNAGTVRSGQTISTIVVHVDKHGNVSFPGRNDATVPPGFQKVELTTLAQARKFTNAFNQRESAEAEQREQVKRDEFEALQQMNRSDLRQSMQRMSPLGRDFANYAMERNNNRPRRNTQANGYFEVAEFDSSNREAQRDASTGWRPRGK
jgi:hypothetical protein